MVAKETLDTKSDTIATKADVVQLREDLRKFHLYVDRRFDQTIFWILATSVAFVGIVIAAVKL